MERILVVGFGIAGSTVCRSLEKSGIDFVCLDKGSPMSSLASAGLINPVTGRNYQMTWLYDTLWPTANAYYSDLNALDGVGQVFSRRELVFPLSEPEKANEFMIATARESTSGLLALREDAGGWDQGKGHFGSVQDVYVVLIERLLTALRERYRRSGTYRQGTFDKLLLKSQMDGIEYNGEWFSKIVFCDGWTTIANHWDIGFRLIPTKGEALLVRIPGFCTDTIWKDCYKIIPLEDDLYWVGSNFEWTFEDDQPTEIFKEKIDNFLKVLIPSKKYSIEKAVAGVRPASRDRKPMLGKVSKDMPLYALNGLGTKGTLFAPWCAQHLIDHLLDPTVPIHPEVDISRKSNLKG